MLTNLWQAFFSSEGNDRRRHWLLGKLVEASSADDLLASANVCFLVDALVAEYSIASWTGLLLSPEPVRIHAPHAGHSGACLALPVLLLQTYCVYREPSL